MSWLAGLYKFEILVLPSGAIPFPRKARCCFESVSALCAAMIYCYLHDIISYIYPSHSTRMGVDLGCGYLI